MAIRYKINVLDALKQAGYTTAKIRKEKILPEGTLQHLRNGEYISLSSVSTICSLLHCQPGDILEYTEEI